MPDWTWILIVVGVVALATLVARTVIAMSPTNEAAVARTAAHQKGAGTDSVDGEPDGGDGGSDGGGDAEPSAGTDARD